LDVPDTPANAAEFGFTGKNGVNQCGNPQARLMALIECGTHAVIDAAFDAVARLHRYARSCAVADARTEVYAVRTRSCARRRSH
jgi:hypothetical protein